MPRDRVGSIALAADQILTGTKATRAGYITATRRSRGFKGAAPSPRERLVCRKNDATLGIFNGQSFVVHKVLRATQSIVELRLMPADGDEARPVEVKCLPDCFTGGLDAVMARDWRERRDTQVFEYGYALTVHLAQGSQWDDVMLIDQSGVFGDQWSRWLYTGITRAASRVTVLL
ncbi:UNVERIFIED_CONTAM: hypothetical protein BEN50_21560 [Euhalothece sp. KZN 001]